ncbi:MULTISPECIES: flagellar biosynthesis protein FlhF [Hydrogenophaga]|uniref:Flagellar biosynthesis protein FlhF n=1 Tax=Hydrogenophaga electricum TaxID=1230953 RepID=A0ABQ6C9M1_9BURK|nr:MULTISPECIES: flagellar biosynthesis protein FlhF [Hydrogenophaga]GLS15419.1 flagellar biosynthesis protein FlhF [Hydrogenophaga electricum]
MNIQRFTASTSREAMAKARSTFGESAVILSTRSTEDGFEVMAAAEESLSALAPAPRQISTQAAAPAPQSPAVADVEDDTATMAMSTLSFQDYVRERMLRKRRAAQGAEAPEAPVAPQRAEAPRAAPMPAPERQPMSAQRLGDLGMASAQVPPPIRTRPAAPSWEEPVVAAPSLGAGDHRISEELSALKDMIEERFNTLAWLGSSKQNPIQSNLMLKLIRAGFSPTMSRAVLERMPAELSPAEAVRWVMDVLARNLKIAAPGAGLADEGGVVALIGATGVGKTTTAAKLAAQCVHKYGTASVGLITLDTYRVAGFEQLRAYGRMLGVVAHQAHDRAALVDLLNLLAGKRMVIIDTAGLGQRDQRIQEMLDLLDMPAIKKTLVLNAGAHGDTLDDVLVAFKASTLHGVVLSKVDEAVKLGPAVDALIRHQVVLRGLANGQRVPEDWSGADAAALVRLSLGSEGKSAYDPRASEMGFYFAQSSARGIDLGGAYV